MLTAARRLQQAPKERDADRPVGRAPAQASVRSSASRPSSSRSGRPQPQRGAPDRPRALYAASVVAEPAVVTAKQRAAGPEHDRVDPQLMAVIAVISDPAQISRATGAAQGIIDCLRRHGRGPPPLMMSRRSATRLSSPGSTTTPRHAQGHLGGGPGLRGGHESGLLVMQGAIICPANSWHCYTQPTVGPHLSVYPLFMLSSMLRSCRRISSNGGGVSVNMGSICW